MGSHPHIPHRTDTHLGCFPPCSCNKIRFLLDDDDQRTKMKTLPSEVFTFCQYFMCKRTKVVSQASKQSIF